ncbi:MAG: putative FAD-dependent oxidoreductase [Actinobacteria bacterium]|nr:putative FAD-dependent oxidoreductase [Actinomycetota bacterium]
MAIRITDIRVALDCPEEELLPRVLSIIEVPRGEVERFSVVRRGLDARRKGQVRRVYAVEISLRSAGLEESVCSRVSSARMLLAEPNPFRIGRFRMPPLRPVVAGAGPAGLFAALTLARFGVPPILLERGRPVEERSRQVAAFWKSGTLDPDSNVQFGEGGAGTFSDGKLTTRIGDPLVAHVTGTFGDFADLPGLVTEAKPHVGTDRLRGFCRRMREELVFLGAEIRFGARVAEVVADGGRVSAVRLAGGEEISCADLVLAVGHSARDTLRMLLARGAKMASKPFAVGFRVEHPQGLIDRIQYGKSSRPPGLPPADYRLAARAPSGRGVYSFCMCPGGEVMAASSAADGMPVNGMSAHGRDSGYANSGIVASVSDADFGKGDVFAGVCLQELLEARAFRKGGGDFGIPAMNLAGFLDGKDLNLSRGKALAPRVVRANLSGILPKEVEEDLRFGLRKFGGAMRGFLSQEATLYAVESRTSSPVRVERENYESVTLKGLYPVGEGAGHAGGIVSSAVDGIRGALRILEKLSV